MQRHVVERKLLKSVVALNNIKQNPSETLIDFYVRLLKDINKMDQQIREENLSCVSCKS